LEHAFGLAMIPPPRSPESSRLPQFGQMKKGTPEA
jgi:hypothetical protein